MAEVAVPVIAVDGPSGVGKGTLCRLLARELGWHVLDSGALYRLIALAALRHQVPLDDESELERLTRDLDARFVSAADEIHVLLEGADVSEAIRSEECGNAASKVAALPAVRAALLKWQRDFRRPPGLIADGRDMGTLVFPDARVKIFLVANPEERAIRRYKQLKEKGINASLAALVEEIAERDERDAKRLVAPLKPAADATILDTTELNIDEVKKRVLAIVQHNL